MRFFIAGIMQGSHVGALLHDQGYRGRITRLLELHFPEAEVYDPLRSIPSRLAMIALRAARFSFDTMRCAARSTCS